MKLETEVDKFTKLALSSPGFCRGTQWRATCKIAAIIALVMWEHVEVILQSAKPQIQPFQTQVTFV